MFLLKWILFSMSVLVLSSCGKGMPHIETPADGSTFTLGTQFFFDVTMVNQDYNDVSITITGDIPAGEVICQNSANGPARCTSVMNGQFGGGQVNTQTCMPGCTAVIAATKGDQRDVRVVKFVRSQGGALPGK